MPGEGSAGAGITGGWLTSAEEDDAAKEITELYKPPPSKEVNPTEEAFESGLESITVWRPDSHKLADEPDKGFTVAEDPKRIVPAGQAPAQLPSPAGF